MHFDASLMTQLHSCEICFVLAESSEKFRFSLHAEIKQPYITSRLRFQSISKTLVNFTGFQTISVDFVIFGKNNIKNGLVAVFFFLKAQTLTLSPLSSKNKGIKKKNYCTYNKLLIKFLHTYLYKFIFFMKHKSEKSQQISNSDKIFI